MTGHYSIQIEEEDIVVRFNRNLVDTHALTRFLDYLDLEILRRRRKLTDDRAKRTCQ